MKGHILTYQSEIDYSIIEPVNDLLSKVKIRILYTGLNRNNSYLSKEVVEKAIESLPYIPIIGEYDKSINNFLGHGGRVIIDREGNVEFEDTVKAYGVVPFFNDSKPRWETYEDSETGKPTEYLVADAYLWTGRYQELDVITDGGSYQSMEILIKDAEWLKSQAPSGMQYDYYNIKDFVFTAFCILGKDEENQENSTIPCFEDAAIEAYSANNKLSSELSQMVAELQSFNLERSVKNLDTIKEDIVVDEKVENNIETEKVETEEFVVDNDNTNIVVVDDVEEVEEDNKVEEAFELSHDEIRNNLYGLLVNTVAGQNNDEYGIWITSVYSDYFVYEIYPDEFYKQDYVMDNTNVSFVGEPIKVYSQFLTEQEVNELDMLKGQAEMLLMENQELKTYKESRELDDKKEEIDKLFEKYNMLDEKEIADIKSNALNLSLADLEKELAYLVVNKSVFSMNKPHEQSKGLVMKVAETKKDDLSLRYGNASKYFKD